MNSDNRTILITGGTRGIGRSLVDHYLKRGWKVISTGRTETSVSEGKKRQPQVEWHACDLARPEQRAAFAEAIGDRDLNVVIHNASIQQARDYFEPFEEEYSETEETEINFLAPIDLTRRLLANVLGPRGHLVYITSGLAIAPKQSSPIYCANKSGLRTFTKSFRQQALMHNTGVRVTEAIMTLVDTDMTRGRGKGKISPDEAAHQVARGIEKCVDEIHVGKVKILMFLRRLMPNFAEQILIKV